MTMMGRLYQTAMTLLWLLGSFFFVQTVRLLLADPPTALQLGVIVGLALCCYMTLFSFFWGAQPGHWFRAVNIVLFAALAWAILQTYRTGASHLSPMEILGIGGTAVFLNTQMRQRFKREYATHGKRNYFAIYFPSARS